MSGDTDHLHLLTRDAANLGGDGNPLTRADIERHLNGTPYRDEPALWDVVTGRSPRGYVIVPAGWVAVVRCTAETQDGCKEVLVDVTIAGDVRHGHEHPDRMIAGIRRLANNKEK